jgi:O-antigen ligase
LGKGSTIVSEPAKSNRRRDAGGLAASFAPLASWAAAGLAGALFVLPALLAITSRGAAPLAGFAGLCAAILLVVERPFPSTATIRYFAALLAALVLWGALSAMWSIVPSRSLVLDARLAGLFIAGIALAAAAGRVPAPWRLCLILIAGTVLGILLAVVDLASSGGLSGYVSIRAFAPPRLNQIAVLMAILTLPLAAVLLCRGWIWLALSAAAVMAGIVCLLAGTTAKIALAVALPMAVALYFRRRTVARIAAALSFIAILAAPTTLPRLGHSPGIFSVVNGFKESAGHRLMIWSFAGDRISERPILGWGLDSSRAIPGGDQEFRPGEKFLPLHPHDAALQVWLELGAPGAALFALSIAGLWWRLGDAAWPRLYAAAAGGGLTAALTVGFAGWGIWQEWWLGTLALALFAILVMARAAAPHR